MAKTDLIATVRLKLKGKEQALEVLKRLDLLERLVGVDPWGDQGLCNWCCGGYEGEQWTGIHSPAAPTPRRATS